MVLEVEMFTLILIVVIIIQWGVIKHQDRIMSEVAAYIAIELNSRKK